MPGITQSSNADLWEIFDATQHKEVRKVKAHKALQQVRDGDLPFCDYVAMRLQMHWQA